MSEDLHPSWEGDQLLLSGERAKQQCQAGVDVGAELWVVSKFSVSYFLLIFLNISFSQVTFLLLLYGSQRIIIQFCGHSEMLQCFNQLDLNKTKHKALPYLNLLIYHISPLSPSS